MIIPTNKQLEKRQEDDYYPTPIELARSAILTMLPKEFIPKFVNDPGAGNGVWTKALKEIYPTVDVFGCDTRDTLPENFNDYSAWAMGKYGNYLDQNYSIFNEPYDLIFGNPPFKFAEEFIDKSFELVKDGGYILFLFRLAFLESKRRYDKYWNNIKPKEVSVLVNRISFTGDKKSDDTAYAMYLWQKGYVGDTKLSWLKWR